MNSGVYRRTCSKCAKGFVGQTGGSFSTRLSEYIQAFRNKSYNSKFYQHFVKNEHCKVIVGNTMEVSYAAENGGGGSSHLNTVENFVFVNKPTATFSSAINTRNFKVILHHSYYPVITFVYAWRRPSLLYT
jgi:hypothetical protein